MAVYEKRKRVVVDGRCRIKVCGVECKGGKRRWRGRMGRDRGNSRGFVRIETWFVSLFSVFFSMNHGYFIFLLPRDVPFTCTMYFECLCYLLLIMPFSCPLLLSRLLYFHALIIAIEGYMKRKAIANN